jgi:hypothetical protein
MRVTQAQRQESQVLLPAVGRYDLHGSETYAQIAIPDSQWEECIRCGRVMSG